MRKKLVIILIVQCGATHAQFGNLQIKSRFDAVYAEIYGQIYNISSNSNNIYDQGQLTWDKTKLYYDNAYDATKVNDSKTVQDRLGSERSSSLEALLRMYEATCDMKYIWEFMEQATQIINCRADKVSPQFSSAPFLFQIKVPWHGRILHPLAHFVYLVQEKNLGNFIIPTTHRTNFNNYTTIGQFSSYVNQQNREMMDYLLTKYWRANDECMCKPEGIEETSACKTKIGEDAISDLNFQAPYGCALIYMYLANPSEISYGVKVVEMARAYLFSHGTVLTPENIGPFIYYRWSHNGWQKKPNGQLRNQYKEDIGHGAFDIMFPILYNKYYSTFYPYVTGGKYFEDYQMVRFRNTLTKSIYNPNHFSTCTSLQPTFNCNVTGTCTGHYYGDNVSSPAPNEYMNYQSNAKNWTGLYVFDNVAGAAPGSSVYSILMNYYINVESCLPITQNNYSGVSIVGLADLVVANYEKEGIGCSNVPQPPSGPSSIVVSPNPVRDVISIASELEIIHVDVITFAGQVVQSDKNTSKINVSALEEGVYLLKVTLENQEIISEKIFIK